MMQQPTLLALLGALSVTASAGRLPRGVGPEFAAHYASRDEFACIRSPSIKISFDRVNDNSCDCPDGSDEPGTAACAFIDPLSPEQPLPGSASGTTNSTPALPGFWCANEGHVGGYVPFSYVNDGVCDYELCCDGSEEFAHVGGVKCENRCAKLGKEHRRKMEEQRQNMERASQKKNAMLKDASEMRKVLEGKVATLRGEIEALEGRKEVLRREYEDVKRAERGKLVVEEKGAGGKLGVLIGLAKRRVAELRSALDLVAQEREALRDKVGELEDILTKFKEEYNPNFNDEGVKAAVKAYEDYAAREASAASEGMAQTELDEILKEDDETTGVNWKAFEEFGDDTDILYKLEAYLPPSLRTFIQEKTLLIRNWLIDHGVLSSPSSSSESSAVRSAREAVESVERQLTDKQRSLTTETTDLDKNYGPSDIFRSLKGSCLELDAGEYTYELCWMEQTTQKSKKGHGNTNMGNFHAIDREMADDEERVDGKSLGKGQRMVMRFEGGQQCWNGPQRRTDVWLACAEREELWRVAEAEKCVYRMEVGTPAACEEEDVVERERGRDEL